MQYLSPSSARPSIGRFLWSRALGLFPHYFLAIALHLPRYVLKRAVHPTASTRMRGTMDDVAYTLTAMQVHCHRERKEVKYFMGGRGGEGRWDGL